jgi:hypothetical protein
LNKPGGCASIASDKMNRTRGFVNQNRFKSSRAIKRLGRVVNKDKSRGRFVKQRIKNNA